MVAVREGCLSTKSNEWSWRGKRKKQKKGGEKKFFFFFSGAWLVGEFALFALWNHGTCLDLATRELLSCILLVSFLVQTQSRIA